jgi:DNA polymerase-3 subunit gamma/tau
MVLIRIAHAADLPTLDEALKSLGDAPQPSGVPAPRPYAPPPTLPGNGGSSAVATSRAPVTSGGGQTMRLVETTPALAEFVAPPQPVEEAPAVPVNSLEDIAALAETHRDRLFKISFKHNVRLVKLEPGRLDVSLTGDAPKTLLGDLKSRLETWTGRRWMVALSREEGGQTLAEVEAAKRNDAILDAKNDPAVAAILARFPGAKIIDVRIPNAPETETGDADLPSDEAADDDETDF